MLCDTNIISVVGFRGVPGATPNVTATATTGPAYSEAEVERTGPNTNPVFNFTIPRGDPGLNGTGVVVNTVAELRTAPNNGTATTLGCNAAGDQGGGFWRYDASSMATDNIGTVVRPTAVASNAPGRWIRQWSDMLDVRWFGAVCDGVTPSHVAVQAAIDAVPNYVGGEVFIPPNTAIGGTIVIGTNYVYTDAQGLKRVGGIPKSGIILRGSNGQGFGFTAAYAPPTLKWVGANGGTMIQINGALNITMRDMVISGNELTQALTRWVSGTTYALGALIIGESPSTTVYRSLQANNTNHAVTDPAWWEVTEYVPDEDGIIQLYPAAAYGLYFEGSNSGWGVSNYEYLVLTGFTKNAVHKTRYAPADVPLANRPGNDYGRNHWVRCTFKQTHKATGVAMDDAIYVYNYDSGVQDVFDHCEWIYRSTQGGLEVEGTYAIWFEGGTPRVHINDSYTVAYNGIFARSEGGTLPTPKFQITQHYSEDINFVRLPNANTRQALYEAVHPRPEGVSIEWLGAGGGGAPLVINGGYFLGKIKLDNVNAPVILANAPQFGMGWPTSTSKTDPHYITNPRHVVATGRSVPSPTLTVWHSAATYDYNAYVREPGPANDPAKAMPVYRSLQDANTSVLSDASKWALTGFTSTHLPTWTAATTYRQGETVRAAGPAPDTSATTIYVSLQNDNLNHPVTDPAWWEATAYTTAPITNVVNIAGTEGHGAINAAAFVPTVASEVTSITVSLNLANGSVFPVTLTGNTVVQNPSNKDSFGRDVGRVITFRINGHSTTTYTVTFTGSEYRLNGGRYRHSGAGKTDVLSFMWDGTYWQETSRAVAIDAPRTALGFAPAVATEQSGANTYAYLSTGSVFPVALTAATTVRAPTNTSLDVTPTVDSGDVGREITFRITGHATTAYNVTFEAAYKLRNGRYRHSGIGKTDVISFMWDGLNWWETRRSAETDAAISALGFVPKLHVSTDVPFLQPNLNNGSVFTHVIQQNNTVVAQPSNVDTTRDIGRSITIRLIGGGTFMAVAFASALGSFKLAGGAYTHSGAGKTDILTFMYDGTYWWETSRAMNMTS